MTNGKRVWSQEQKEKFSATVQKQWDEGLRVPYVRTKEHKKLMAEKCRKASLKKWRDPEWREMILKALRSPERRKKLSVAFKGREFSEESLRRMSVAHKKQWEDPTYREMMVVAHNTEDYKEGQSKRSKYNAQLREEKQRAIMKMVLVADELFSYIKGCVEGDGWFGNREVHLATVDEDWALHFAKVIEEWSSVKPTLTVRKKAPYQDQHYVNLYNRFVMEFIRDTEPTDFLEFLKGFFDAEGCFHLGKRKSSRYISLTSSNLTLLQKIQNYLLCYGVHTYISKKPQVNGRIGDHVLVARKTSYHLYINRNRDIFWFYKNIGFRIGRKQKRLEEWWDWMQAFHPQKYLESQVYA